MQLEFNECPNSPPLASQPLLRPQQNFQLLDNFTLEIPDNFDLGGVMKEENEECSIWGSQMEESETIEEQMMVVKRSYRQFVHKGRGYVGGIFENNCKNQWYDQERPRKRVHI